MKAGLLINLLEDFSGPAFNWLHWVVISIEPQCMASGASQVDLILSVKFQRAWEQDFGVGRLLHFNEELIQRDLTGRVCEQWGSALLISPVIVLSPGWEGGLIQGDVCVLVGKHVIHNRWRWGFSLHEVYLSIQLKVLLL